MLLEYYGVGLPITRNWFREIWNRETVEKSWLPIQRGVQGLPSSGTAPTWAEFQLG